MANIKGSSTLEQLGSIHANISKIILKQQNEILKMIEVDEVSPLAVADSKLMNAWAAWMKQNDVGSAPEESEMDKLYQEQLKKIRDKSKNGRLRIVNSDDK